MVFSSGSLCRSVLCDIIGVTTFDLNVTKDDHVELVYFHRRTQTLVSVHCAIRLFSKAMVLKRSGAREPTLQKCMLLPTRARSCASSDITLEGSTPPVVFFFFAPDVAAVVARGLGDRCPWLPLIPVVRQAHDIVHPLINFGTRTQTALLISEM